MRTASFNYNNLDMGEIGIVIADRNSKDIELCTTTLNDIGAKFHFLNNEAVFTKQLQDQTTGLLVLDGPEVTFNDQEWTDDSLALAEMEILKQGLNRDLPILCIGRGFHLLNLLEGGAKPVTVLSNHLTQKENEDPRHEHLIFLSPGAKTSATMGTTGFFKVNSYHHHGIYDKQKSNNLIAMAYAVEDGLIEILESPNHSWVVATQFNLERLQELPRLFVNLFLALMERSETKTEN